jgi:CheY-like chemotaxis protein
MAAAKRVLVVEDDPAARRRLAALLDGHGYLVRTAGDGLEALAHLRANPPPDLILLKLRLPVLDGWEFRERQRRDPDLACVPVVVLHGAGEADGREDVLGSVGFLPTPCGADELAAAVERFATPPTPGPGLLIADDDPAVLGMLDVALQDQGFTVHTAGGGPEAVRLYGLRHPEVSVVLLDVQMPGLDGPQTLAALQLINPAVRCVFMSGNTGRYTAADLLGLGACRVLAKPFPDLGELVRVLREAAGA